MGQRWKGWTLFEQALPISGYNERGRQTVASVFRWEYNEKAEASRAKRLTLEPILFPRFLCQKEGLMAGLNSVGFSTNDENEVDLESLRARYRKMSDTKLQRDIQAGEYLCSPQANFGKPPRQVFVIALREARAESERRNAAKD